MQQIKIREEVTLLHNLCQALGSQEKVAEAMRTSQQRINYWLHTAKKLPYDQVLQMQKLLAKVQAKSDEGFDKKEVEEKDKTNLQDFMSDQAIMLNKSLFNIESVFQNEKLKGIEERLQLPIRTSFALLLMHCCDEHGEFELDAKVLKEEVLPYSDIDFDSILNTLCELGLIEKFDFHGKPYGLISLENYTRSMSSSRDKEQHKQPLDFFHDVQRGTTRNSRQYH
jgi:hypothetical protein